MPTVYTTQYSQYDFDPYIFDPIIIEDDGEDIIEKIELNDEQKQKIVKACYGSFVSELEAIRMQNKFFTAKWEIVKAKTSNNRMRYMLKIDNRLEDYVSTRFIQEELGGII